MFHAAAAAALALRKAECARLDNWSLMYGPILCMGSCRTGRLAHETGRTSETLYPLTQSRNRGPGLARANYAHCLGALSASPSPATLPPDVPPHETRRGTPAVKG